MDAADGCDESNDGGPERRGLCTLSSAELHGILGLASDAVRERLGELRDAVVHRDELMLLPGA